MHIGDNRTFKERLEVGNKQEDELINILNWCGVPAKKNNSQNVYDIDIELIKDDMFVDCKLTETPFLNSKYYNGIDPDKCITLNIKHIKSYDKKEKETGKKCWIAFFVNYEKFNVHELVFIPNSYIVHLIQIKKLHVNNGKVSLDRTIGRDMHLFLNYIKELRKIKEK